MKAVNFQVEGEFVCELARSWFWDENRDYSKCEELLLACLESDEVTLEEKKKIVVEILEGRKKLVGVNEVTLVDDNENIRPLSDKIAEYKKKEIIRAIEEDIQRRPLAYLDPYSCYKNPEEYEPVRNLQFEDKHALTELFGAYLTPYQELRVWAYSVENFWYSKSWLLAGFWNEAERPFLDNGFYLIERPELVYKLIGGPVASGGTETLVNAFRDYLQEQIEKKKLPEAAITEILHRNNRHKADLAEKQRQEVKAPESTEKPNKEELNELTKPDDFLSEYGLIDRLGNYYSCSFAGHHVKAFNILREREGKCYQLDEALDKLYSDGWAFIRNPDIHGSVFFDFRADRRPTKKQIDVAFTHMIRFNEPTLRHLSEYLEE